MPVEENKPENHSSHILGSSKCDLPEAHREFSCGVQQDLQPGLISLPHSGAEAGPSQCCDLTDSSKSWWDSGLMSLGPGHVMELQWWMYMMPLITYSRTLFVHTRIQYTFLGVWEDAQKVSRKFLLVTILQGRRAQLTRQEKGVFWTWI